MVVAQLAVRLLPTPEISGSNPDIGNKKYFKRQLQSRKDENKEKEAGNDPIKKAILSCAAWTISGFKCTQAGAKNLKDIAQTGGGGTRRRMDELRSESCEFKSPFTHKLCLIAFWCWLFSDFLRSSFKLPTEGTTSLVYAFAIITKTRAQLSDCERGSMFDPQIKSRCKQATIGNNRSWAQRLDKFLNVVVTFCITWKKNSFFRQHKKKIFLVFFEVIQVVVSTTWQTAAKIILSSVIVVLKKSPT